MDQNLSDRVLLRLRAGQQQKVRLAPDVARHTRLSLLPHVKRDKSANTNCSIVFNGINNWLCTCWLCDTLTALHSAENGVYPQSYCVNIFKAFLFSLIHLPLTSCLFLSRVMCRCWSLSQHHWVRGSITLTALEAVYRCQSTWCACFCTVGGDWITLKSLYRHKENM